MVRASSSRTSLSTLTLRRGHFTTAQGKTLTIETYDPPGNAPRIGVARDAVGDLFKLSF